MKILNKANLSKGIQEPDYAFRRLLRTFWGMAIRKRGTGMAFHPHTVTLFLTHSCNQRCRMCGFWGNNGAPNRASNQRMTLAEYGELLDQLSKFKPTICLFGGEPLLYPEFDALLRHINRLRFRSHLITNGLELTRHTETVAEYLDRLTISLNGPPAVHDDIVCVSGAFEQAIQGLNEIQRVRKSKSGKRLHANILFTITKSNVNAIVPFLTHIAQLQVDSVTIQHLSFIEPEYAEKHKKLIYKSWPNAPDFTAGFERPESGIDATRLHAEIQKIKTLNLGFPVHLFPDFNEEQCVSYYTSDAFTAFGNARCKSPWYEVTVMPDGSVTPCLELSMGNIHEEPFAKIWNGPEYRRFRQTIITQSYPYCIRCCGLYRY